MNLLIFILFLVVGFWGSERNIHNKKTPTWFKLFFMCLFILCGMSRIGHSKEFSDLTYYIDYFENDVSTYFEPGYLLLTEFVKKVFGQAGKYLVLVVGVFISLCLCFSYRILEKGNQYETSRKEFFFIFTFLFLVYWGLAFEAERIRIGLATSLLILSTSLAFGRYGYWSYIPSVFAIFFQYTTIIYLPIVWLIQKEFSLPSKQIYYTWLVILLIFDFLVINFNVFNSLFIFEYINLIDFEQISHYQNYDELSQGSYSLQYFWYHLAPLFFLIGDFKDKQFNKGVLLYFIGLTLSSFMQTITGGHRVADMLEIMIVFPLTYSLINNKVKIRNFHKAFYVYIIVQATMCARYLSISI